MIASSDKLAALRETVNRFRDLTHAALWDSDGERARRPVFIIGVHRRSGTNFLADALQLTDDFLLPLPIAEDYLLQYSSFLVEYAENTVRDQYAKRFNHELDGIRACTNALLKCLGTGLKNFLTSYLPEDRRLLTKTPDPWNIDNFFTLFPDALMIIIVRDGRDCVESSKWAFPGRSYLYWMATWAINARTVVHFLDNLPDQFAGQVVLTRYEDLLRHRDEMQRILKFTGCRAETFPWDNFDKLPVRGSTFYRGGEAKLHWRPVEKTERFNPVGRWTKWSWWLRFHFQRLAGRENAIFGYS